ncbi:protein of unknown function UPF0066 [Desulfarculus baarsii DSM 2075]|uniref:TsaA-like domain-containing protein n=1 Tax=Desulfarculus baarsii (strain ATCC 33931 / DSM 2075 / LMG 7858 / VKM B-1802 / 2st14) TaxID=644282 RepID=E1QG47_DESB2|nr:tRNA (N6-threonylcarbamoyladenosine(37)-N6)-methyltransferase TrmO [Desulfarculus baarsii]ADK83559.1 protein of unknown function UPF0066 [Desulfarculus baarsii DSM 2075]
MNLEPVSYAPIGVARSPHADAAGAPIQPSGARGQAGHIILRPELAEGLRDLEGFSHLIVIYHCHQSGPARLLVTPFLDEAAHGVFATRAPARPNAIGLSVVRLAGVRDNVIDILDVDLLDGTPILDVKPLVPAFDLPQGPVRVGWLATRASQADQARADERFSG